MPFPIHRPRRLGRNEQIRSLVRETRLTPEQFILPLFVCGGEKVRKEIGSMPGNFQLSIDELVIECNADDAERAAAWVSACLEYGMRQFLKRVPVRVDVKISADWSGKSVGELAP